MMHFIRNIAFAAVAAVGLTGSALATTVTLVPSTGVTASLADDYTYVESLVGSAGVDSRSFTFSLPGTTAMVLDAFDLTLTAVQGSSISGAFISWTDGVTTNSQLLAKVFDPFTGKHIGWGGSLSTVLTAAIPSQDLIIGWTGYTGPVGITLQVETSVVPVPAGGFLLLTGLGAVVALRRRKAAA